MQTWELYIQACCWVLGETPCGLAGTGKTESVKTSGNFFGRQMLMFICNEVSTSWWGLPLFHIYRAEVLCYQSHVVFSYVRNFTVRCRGWRPVLLKYKAPLPVFLLCNLLHKFHSPTLLCFGQFSHYSRAWTSSPWVASSLVWSGAVPAAALKNSTVWRKPCYLHCPYRFRPSKTSSRPECTPQNC